MGSSHRSDLKNGHMKTWEGKLQQACDLIREVAREVWEYACEGDQFDNSADDGALAEKLKLAARLVEEELPSRESN
ncbi:hypothetical protein LCGC14_2719920 [marine sediment metagenome]|uniref:Uncharacterized protein n=1 Tax=marine sediment metagenome TaxID=412755 RepID=A0A0F8ZY02_9ZZZZ